MTGDHVFTAAWVSDYLNTYLFNYRLKYDEEETLNHIDLRLMSSDGEVEEWVTHTTVLSDTEIMENLCIETIDEYYFTVEAEDGYTVTIENTGKYAGITDRCYTGGIITVQKVSATPTPEVTSTVGPEETPTAKLGETPTARPVPKTGDTASPVLWIVLVVLGIIGIGATVLARRDRK